VCALQGALALSAAVPEAVVAAKPGGRIGRYKLLEQIGEGGCGVVFMAEQSEPIRRLVALKVVKLGMDTRQVVARFEAERQALALMDHPNIARVLDAGATDTGRPFFVMELVRGVRITDYCDQNCLSTRERLDLFIQVCHAVQHAHQKGVIHRDLKPSNILIALQDGVPVPKVIDFGIAKATGQQLLTDKTLFTAFQQFLGTPAYMSPEQAEMSGLDVDTRSDIYSLGVLLYELLTGHPPFDARRLLQAGLGGIQRIIREEEPPRPSARISTLDAAGQTALAKRHRCEPPRLLSLIRGDLDWIVMKMLEKDRTQRYETANAVAADVQRHLENEPVVARPPSRLYRFQKMVRRNKAAFGTAALTAAVLVAATGISAWQAIRAGRESRRSAEANRRTGESLEQLEIQRAESFFSQGRPATGLAQLAAALRHNPRNRVAASRLLSALSQRSSALPCAPPLNFDGELLDVRFSPDGNYLFTAWESNRFRIWDARTALPLVPPIKLDQNIDRNTVLTVGFSSDGRRLLFLDGSGRGRVWDTRTGHPIGVTLTNFAIAAMAFSKDGQQVVMASPARGDPITLTVEDLTTGQLSTRLLDTPFHATYEGVRLDAEGKTLARFSPMNQDVWVFDTSSGHAMAPPLPHESGVNGVAFSPDGTWLATASADKSARVWDLATGKTVAPRFRHDTAVEGVLFSPDGEHLASIETDFTTKLWEIRSGRLLNSSVGPGKLGDFAAAGGLVGLGGPVHFDGPADLLGFSRDGQRIWARSPGGWLKTWDIRGGQTFVASLAGVCFPSPGGERGATALGRTVQLRDLRIRHQAAEFLRLGKRLENGADKVLLFPDGKAIIQSTLPPKVQVWDCDAFPPRQLAEITNRIHIRSTALSPNGKLLLITSYGGTSTFNGKTVSETNCACIWDVRTGRLLYQFDHNNHVDPQFSSDSKYLITTSGDTVRMWNVEAGGAPAEFKHDGSIEAARLSPDGRRMVSFGYRNDAVLWDVGAQVRLAQLRHNDRVCQAIFSPDGSCIVTCSSDKTARIWDARTGKPISGPLLHSGEVESAQFSPDGARVLTACSPGQGLTSIRVWETRSGRSLAQPISLENELVMLTFNPDGQRLLTASSLEARVWDASTGRPLTRPIVPSETGDLMVIVSAQFDRDGNRILVAATPTDLFWNVPLHHRSIVRLWDSRTGQPLTEPLEFEQAIKSARFSPDDQHLLIATADGRMHIWELLQPPLPVPDWLPELAEAAAGRSLDEQGVLEPSPGGALLTIKRAVEQAAPGDYYADWAKWFFDDGDGRRLSPHSRTTVTQYVEALTQENTLQTLRKALLFSPSNGLALARLVRHLSEPGSDDDEPASPGELDFLSRRATTLTPDQPQVWLVRAEVVARVEPPARALETIEQSLARFPEIPGLWTIKGLVLIKVGQLDEARQVFDKALALTRKVKGAERLDTLGAMHNLVNSYRDAGRLEEALKLQQEVLPLLLESMVNLAACYEQSGRKSEAEALRRELAELKAKAEKRHLDGGQPAAFSAKP
jgi:WD40 repeat protein/serine/threonine protein kinase/tetratricopeptide (TPR) repeat protein